MFLAENSVERQTKVASCELLHALVTAAVGYHAQVCSKESSELESLSTLLLSDSEGLPPVYDGVALMALHLHCSCMSPPSRSLQAKRIGAIQACLQRRALPCVLGVNRLLNLRLSLHE